MKFSLSNIALTAHNHLDELPLISAIGFEGLEVAVSRVWRSGTPTLSEVEQYRRAAEDAGLTVIGLHSLFFDRPDLRLFQGDDSDQAVCNFLLEQAEICAALGGRSMIFGSPGARNKGLLPDPEADRQLVDFFKRLGDAMGQRSSLADVCICIEALCPSETDYIHTGEHAMRLTHEIDNPHVRMHLDAKAVAEAREDTIDFFNKVAPLLVHFHVNDPGMGIVGQSGMVDHLRLGSLLRHIEYAGFVSIEQKMLDTKDALGPVEKSFGVLKECYS